MSLKLQEDLPSNLQSWLSGSKTSPSGPWLTLQSVILPFPNVCVHLFVYMNKGVLKFLCNCMCIHMYVCYIAR